VHSFIVQFDRDILAIRGSHHFFPEFASQPLLAPCPLELDMQRLLNELMLYKAAESDSFSDDMEAASSESFSARSANSQEAKPTAAAAAVAGR
jgi:hypothetical protein